ncbi:alpha/beta hydrolase [Sinorhizobium psoraleae]|uniref:Alpha/beta-hydrolase family protein n=1 Tax=Sinorhizobium psoraleae TaxID=520838 RepID=A0ABT4KMA9_9HYPH|nr:alpha/beta-hydrolase family protein [Sinorhizobium psoraleae]MCZ4092052.1 alpha/beta-hydrolase family protein [Sinorhizobium psoraleae]
MEHLQQTHMSRPRPSSQPARLWGALSTTGLLVGVLFFAVSLTPSLIPRPYLVQGAISGLSLAAGYAIGVFLRGLWSFFELPDASPRRERTLKIVAGLVCGAAVAVFLWQTAGWQNTVRNIMGLEPIETVAPLKLGLLAALVFFVLVFLARLFLLTFHFLSRMLERLVTRPIARAIGGLVAIALFWSVADGLIFKLALRAADSSFQQLDALIDADVAPPSDPAKTGSAASLVNWDELGRQGRQFIASGPTGAEIGAFFGDEARDPVRVYVGLNSAETARDRAKLALEELKRAGGFERKSLLVVVPTGTGWIDPAALDPVEYLLHGDVASVAVQYSYLTSWLSLLVEPGYGADAANALFDEVYSYWKTLPKDRRPKLYLHGLSLGAMNSQGSVDLFDVISDPFQGALWSGPPFPSGMWQSVTADRDPSSPAWLPRYRDSSVIRFTSQENALDMEGARWGAMRIVYLQYASDPVTFFDPHAFYREPQWMKAPRGPDVSPALRWFPVVTGLQLLADMALATTSPIGYGHVYAPEHYIDAWTAVTDPPTVTPEDVTRLKTHFKGKF